MTLLSCEMRARDTVHLPYYPGTTLRGALGRSLRAIACDTGYIQCQGCERIHHCPYGSLWEAPLPEHLETPETRGFLTPPKPYVVEPLWEHKSTTLHRGQTFRFHLKLFGRARSHLPWFISALQRAAKQGLGQGRKPLELERVVACGPKDEHNTIYTRRDGLRIEEPAPRWLLTFDGQPTPTPSRPARIRLDLRTPLHIKHRGDLLPSFDPAVLTQTLCTRLEHLSTFHHHAQTRWNPSYFHTLASSLKRWKDCTQVDQFQRVSMLQNKRIDMRGLTGHVTLERVPPDLISLWALAQHTHVGKQATFGFGNIGVQVLSR